MRIRMNWRKAACIAIIGIALAMTMVLGRKSASADALILHTQLKGLQGYELLVWRNRFPPHSATDLHHHAGHEFVYILDGTITARIGAEDMAVKSGEMFYVEPGQTMKVSNAGDKPGTILVIPLAKRGNR